MSFDTLELSNEQYLVSGTDIRGNWGEQVIDGSQWNEIKRASGTDEAKAAMEEAIEKFFEPLSKALDEYSEAKAPKVDDLAVVVLSEGSPGVDPSVRQVVHLWPDSQVLRAIDEGKTDRLIWVDGRLVITAK